MMAARFASTGRGWIANQKPKRKARMTEIRIVLKTTQRFPGGIYCFSNYAAACEKLKLMKSRRREARLMNGDQVVGRVWKEGRRWNYFFETGVK
jgi:hypothetical protein